jgi:hypothetical protein
MQQANPLLFFITELVSKLFKLLLSMVYYGVSVDSSTVEAKKGES